MFIISSTEMTTVMNEAIKRAKCAYININYHNNCDGQTLLAHLRWSEMTVEAVKQVVAADQRDASVPSHKLSSRLTTVLPSGESPSNHVEYNPLYHKTYQYDVQYNIVPVQY